MIKKIYIGGHDRAGTTLLASFVAGIPNSKVLFETPFKFFYISKNQKSFFKLTKLCSEYDNPKYFEAYGLKKFPIEKFVNNLFSDEGLVIDHTPKNILFKKEINNKNSLFIFITREIRALFLAHKRVKWGIKSPIKFVVWYHIVKQLALKYSLENNVELLTFENLLEKQDDLIKSILNKHNLKFTGRKEIGMPDYTKKQHNKVNKKIDFSKVSADNFEFSFYEKMILKERFIFKIFSKLFIKLYI